MKSNQGLLPYLSIFLLLIASVAAYFAAGLTSNKKENNSNYPQGYYIKNSNVGEMRIIPLGGQSLKSPLATDPGAVYSPFSFSDKK